MDGPHLAPAGALSRGQAVLFRVWWGNNPQQVCSEAYRMGYVLEFDSDCVFLELCGEIVLSRPDCLYTHPDMVAESRTRKIEDLGL